MRHFLHYLKHVFSTAWGVLFLIAGAISTGVTFILMYRPGFAQPYWIPGAISIFAWLVAPYRLYEEQRTQIEAFTATQQRARRANLKIIEEQGSYFIRRSSGQTIPK